MTQGVVRKISDKVWVLGDPYYQVYLVGGERYALIESGLTYTVAHVVKQLAELQVPPENIHYLILAHAHFDHDCGTPGLQKAFPNLQVVASPIATKVFGKEKVVTGHFLENNAVLESLRAKGELASIDETFEAPKTINVDITVNEGDVLDLGEGCQLHFYLTPGHSPCSMSIYLPLGEVLWPSDACGYLFKNNDLMPMYFSSYADYVSSIRRLTAIDTSVLAAPHELLLQSKKEVDQFMQKAMAHTEDVHRLIVKGYQVGRSYAEISDELFRRMYLDGLANQSHANIRLCTDLMVRRSLEFENIPF